MDPATYTKEDILNIISIHTNKITLGNKDLKALGNLKKLGTLNFTDTTFTDEIFKNIRYENLGIIGFHHLDLPDFIGKSLNGSQFSEKLSLYNVKVEENFFCECTGMPIQWLFLYNNDSIDESQLEKMLPLQNLEYIYIDNCPISDSITTFFDSCPKLLSISVSNINVECSFIKDMKNKEKITSISLYKTNIDDETLAYIVNYPNLKEIEIEDSRVTEKSKELLKDLSKRLWAIDVSNGDNTIFSSLNRANY